MVPHIYHCTPNNRNSGIVKGVDISHISLPPGGSINAEGATNDMVLGVLKAQRDALGFLRGRGRIEIEGIEEK